MKDYVETVCEAVDILEEKVAKAQGRDGIMKINIL